MNCETSQHLQLWVSLPVITPAWPMWRLCFHALGLPPTLICVPRISVIQIIPTVPWDFTYFPCQYSWSNLTTRNTLLVQELEALRRGSGCTSTAAQQYVDKTLSASHATLPVAVRPPLNENERGVWGGGGWGRMQVLATDKTQDYCPFPATCWTDLVD